MTPALAPPPLDRARNALFLDLDGTVAEIAPRPDDVGPEPRRTAALHALIRDMEGRVAVLTGRTLAEADHILDGAVVAVAAVHGLIRRGPGGEMVTIMPSPRMPQATQALNALAEGRPGLLVEEKGVSVALHFRQAPDAEAVVRETAGRLARTTGLVLQDGSMVSELRTEGPHKGDSLTALMSEAPFVGCVPVMVGDDLTDEHAFAAAVALGGFGVLVGPARPSHARFRLESVEAVMDWLERGAAQ